MITRHTLIAGVTGSGKSYVENNLIKRILADDPRARLVLIDPKMVELMEYEKTAAYYTDTIEGTYDAVMFAYNTMRTRNEQLKQKNRETGEFKKEVDDPPMYVVVDEMGAVMNDKKHRKTYEELFGKIGQLGRSAHVILILCTQNPTRRNLPEGLKDNLTNKVMLRQEDVSRYQYVLGKGANDLAPLPRIGKAYFKTDMDAPTMVSTNADSADLWNLLNN